MVNGQPSNSHQLALTTLEHSIGVWIGGRCCWLCRTPVKFVQHKSWCLCLLSVSGFLRFEFYCKHQLPVHGVCRFSFCVNIEMHSFVFSSFPIDLIVSSLACFNSKDQLNPQIKNQLAVSDDLRVIVRHWNMYCIDLFTCLALYHLMVCAKRYTKLDADRRPRPVPLQQMFTNCNKSIRTLIARQCVYMPDRV